MIVNTTSPFEEFFIRRNALVIFMHRILRSAQINNASLRPALPGANTFCTCKCGALPPSSLVATTTWSSVRCTTFSTTRRNVRCSFVPRSRAVLFPALQPGMRVQRGPDWQWTDQDGGVGHLGTVMTIKEWKGYPMGGVRVHWDDMTTGNTYRYGGENCYDVVL